VPGLWVAVLFATLAASAAGGCARFYWVKPGSTEEQFARDSAACEQESTASPAAARSVEQRTYRECLEVRGYTRQNLYSPGPDAHRGIEKQP
jgi:hypothetical protein